jgi:hypothetical protein
MNLMTVLLLVLHIVAGTYGMPVPGLLLSIPIVNTHNSYTATQHTHSTGQQNIHPKHTQIIQNMSKKSNSGPPSKHLMRMNGGRSACQHSTTAQISKDHVQPDPATNSIIGTRLPVSPRHTCVHKPARRHAAHQHTAPLSLSALKPNALTHHTPAGHRACPPLAYFYAPRVPAQANATHTHTYASDGTNVCSKCMQACM